MVFQDFLLSFEVPTLALETGLLAAGFGVLTSALWLDLDRVLAVILLLL